MVCSLVIPTKDRPKALASCLAAVAELRHAGAPLEVVVVDDGSATPLDEVVQPFRDRLDIVLHRQPNRGPAAARNAGAARANGDFLAFTDDDCCPDTMWLKRLLDRCPRGFDGMVGGRTVNRLDENPFATASQDLVDYLYEYYNAEGERGQFLTSNNVVVGARSFRDLGGFDEGFPMAAAEDRDLCDRWLASGRAMLYEPSAVVYHHHDLTAWRFWRQHFNYGRGAARFQRNRRQRSGTGNRFEPLRFYRDLVRYESRRRGGLRGAILTFLFVVTQVANVAGFAVERATPGMGSRQPRSGHGTMRDHG